MLDSTLTTSPGLDLDGGLPMEVTAPLISEAFGLNSSARRIADGSMLQEFSTSTLPIVFVDSIMYGARTWSATTDDMAKLNSEIDFALSVARSEFGEIDNVQLENAYIEAKALAASKLFGGELVPNVSVDPFGEFTFYHRSSAGYVDIGVRGESELSYHVRNDVHPEHTCYDDFAWDTFEIPRRLFDAINALKRCL